MDHLVLIRVSAALDAALAGARLRDVRDDAPRRLRLVFEGEVRPISIVVSLDPREPWIGRPVSRAQRRPRRGALAARLRRALGGARVTSVAKAGVGRRVEMRFADGHRVVIELAPHRADLQLIDPGGRVEARAGRSGRGRPRPGERWEPAAAPTGVCDPTALDAGTVDARLREIMDDGASLTRALRRVILGLGAASADLVAEESSRSGCSPGDVLATRVGRLVAGELDPVIAGAKDPWAAATAGTLDLDAIRLLAWEPAAPSGGELLSREDPAATAGLYHESVELQRDDATRWSALRRILEREIDRLSRVVGRAEADLESFEDPGRYRRWGEALLAGIGRERRVGEGLVVPDPYDATGGELVVPVPAGRSPTDAAEELFRRHRRARRGLESARRRVVSLEAQRERLQALRERHERSSGRGERELLEAAMRRQGLAVGLRELGAGGRGSTPAGGRARIEGVRLIAAADGRSIMVGKTGKDNHRLTFKVAGPEDFWFHALGCPGAHVIVRNEERRARPPDDLLREAAAVAAWFSEGRRQERADVQWTRRKYVRRPRGAAPGTVVIKRFETIRVRPGLPSGGSARFPEDGETA